MAGSSGQHFLAAAGVMAAFCVYILKPDLFPALCVRAWRPSEACLAVRFPRKQLNHANPPELHPHRSPEQSAAFKAAPVIVLALGVAYGATAGKPQPVTSYAWLVCAGLLASGCGDVFLEFEDRNSGAPEGVKGIDFFLLGLVSFFVGHVAYVWAFWMDAFPPISNALPLAAYGAGLVSYMWEHIPADLKVPVIAYATVICLMAFRAVSRHYTTPYSRPGAASFITGAAGALLFVVSDSVLALNKFLPQPVLPAPYGRLAVMVTYYAAQLLIAASATTNLPSGAFLKLNSDKSA